MKDEEYYIEFIVGCEESQEVTKELRKLGIQAYSCDLQPCSGGHPEWHIQDDIFEVITRHPEIKRGVFFPTCTYLTISANRWYKDQPQPKSGALVGQARREARREAINFFLKLYNCQIEELGIENPIGIMSTVFRKPDQVLQPWMFGHGETKATCLWLKNLPKLKPTNIVEGREGRIWKMTPGPERTKLRSKTYPGIARAMAEQWGTEYKPQPNYQNQLQLL